MFSDMIRQQIRVLYRPGDAYQAMKRSRFISIAIAYGALLVVNCILTEVLSLAMAGERDLIFIPLFMGTVGLFICAAVLHVPVLILGGRQGFLKTLSVVMYGVTPVLTTSWIFGILGNTGIIPILWIYLLLLYLLLFFAWSFILIIVGLKEAQELTLTRSALAAGIALVLLFVIIVATGHYYLSLLPMYPPYHPAPFRIEAVRVNDSIVVINQGLSAGSADQIARLEVSRDDTFHEVLGMEKMLP